MSDIYKQAEEMNADVMDYERGYIYKVQNYNQCKKMGLPTPGIEVVDFEGNHIGYAQKMD